MAAVAAPVRLLVLLLLTAAAALSGCGERPERRTPPAAPAAATLLGTESERAGEAVYRREGCPRCHTLFDAPLSGRAADLPRPDAPLLPSRVGPDLGIEGHRRSDDWQLAHLYAPGVLTPGTPMPAERSLFAVGGDAPFAPRREALDLVAYLQALGRARRDVWAEFRRSEPEIPGAPSAGPALLERGTRLYQEHCLPCHGRAGDGRGAAAALLASAPRDFVAAHYRFRSTPPGDPPADDDLFRSITLGGGTGSAMPAFFWLPADDRWALVLRLKEFSPRLRGTGLERSGPAGRPVGSSAGAGAPRGSAGEGRRQWAALGCAACHGEDAAGLSRAQAGTAWSDPAGVPIPGSGDLRHACGFRGGASDEAILHGIERGVGAAMPAFGDLLGERGARDLLAYLRSLDRSPGP